MKILSAAQTKEADQFTIKNEPIASIELMERASQAFTDKFCEHFDPQGIVHVFAGMGNNGGDALCIARLLSARGYEVNAYAVRFSDNPSGDFQKNEERLNAETPVNLQDINDDTSLPAISDEEIVIDGLFGSGLNRPVEGLPAQVIEHLNDSDAIRVAIDIPSGIFADQPSEGPAFEADLTITFQQPKLAFMMPDNYPYVGEWVAVDIGLDTDFIEKMDSPYALITLDYLVEKWRFRSKFDYKNTFGHALIAAGSAGKTGAAILSAKACLKTGAGLVTAHLPRCGVTAMHSSIPEVMVSLDPSESELTGVKNIEPYNVMGVGPGIGTSAATANMLKVLIDNSQVPLVLDADALNLLSNHPDWMPKLPKGTILTPHPGELQRLMGQANNGFEALEMARNLAQRDQLIVIVKRAHSAVCLPDGQVWFGNTGNPGMATAGSGDVLTGIITSLVAQQYPPEEAAIIGVTIHGMAGDEAAFTYSEQGMTATNIIDELPTVCGYFEEG